MDRAAPLVSCVSLQIIGAPIEDGSSRKHQEAWGRMRTEKENVRNHLIRRTSILFCTLVIKSEMQLYKKHS